MYIHSFLGSATYLKYHAINMYKTSCDKKTAIIIVHSELSLHVYSSIDYLKCVNVKKRKYNYHANFLYECKWVSFDN